MTFSYINFLLFVSDLEIRYGLNKNVYIICNINNPDLGGSHSIEAFSLKPSRGFKAYVFFRFQPFFLNPCRVSPWFLCTQSVNFWKLRAVNFQFVYTIRTSKGAKLRIVYTRYSRHLTELSTNQAQIGGFWCGSCTDPMIDR